jgi:GNAT superfamily N-acetyltransferase
MQELTLSIASAADAENLSDFVNQAYRGEFATKGWTTETHLLDGLRITPEFLKADIADPNQVVLMFHKANELLACVALTKKDGYAYLGMLTVSPLLQGGGIGRQVLNAAEAWVKKRWNSSRMQMTVIQSRTELLEWYYRRGYVNTGRTEAFPPFATKIAQPKVDLKELAMLVLAKDL